MAHAIILIQCRFDSKRAPGKILRELRPGLSCLEYLIQRLGNSNFNCLIATTDRDEDLPIVEAFNELRGKYSHLIGYFRGDYDNIAKRLYDATEGYDYFVRVTGDDIFVDTDILNSMVAYTMENNLDYVYPKDLIRGCDSDVFKRSAIHEAMSIYDTSKMESIEFLFKNERFKQDAFSVPGSYKIPFSLTLDTEQDWNLLKIVFEKLYRMDPFFTTWDIAEFFSRNNYLANVNRNPKVSIYVTYKDYPARWLQECMDSIRLQTYKDVEIILIDYGSKQIHTFLKYINDKTIETYSLADTTFIEAIKFAVHIARGKYIMRVDADDTLTPEALQKMITYLDTNPFYSAVVADHYVLEETCANYQRSGDSLDFPLPTCALIEKKKYQYVEFREGQPFRDKINWVYSFEKYDFTIGFLHEPLFYYRMHSQSISHGGIDQETIDKEEQKIKEYFNKDADKRKPNH